MNEKKDMPEVDRVAASKKAIAARQARALIKKNIASKKVSPLEVLEEAKTHPDGPSGRMRVTDFLASVPGIGVKKRGIILDELVISPVKRLGGLGYVQRERLERRAKNSFRKEVVSPGRLFVLSGPSGVGKGTVVSRLRRVLPNVSVSVSATTRSPRANEKHGVDYFFVSQETFRDMIDSKQMLEWATVHSDHFYGTPKAAVMTSLASGHDVLCEIDIQGARRIKKSYPDAVLVFLAPPSFEELSARLLSRGTENAEERSRRLNTAREELSCAQEFDYSIVNVLVEQAVKDIVDLMRNIKN